ncbi:M48 family metallopeptidase [Oscillatoria sp. FACHB-1407]|uniref:M48 family metallopeptidase n=1 Tax=Oscillatoria sp. FACHB-1407 TaxID=2692847 RepID=UPI001684BA16|nr:M48 family metallopeptidase [Oscillatoria sp. FACHB-1407]MBD2461084.1 M48 family metallopeptidase [Oscillatoria sp. FACHB-1407]
MSFFEHQDRARRNTQQLVGLFILSLICVVLCIYGAALIAFGVTGSSVTVWQPELFFWTAVLTTGVVGLGSWYKAGLLKAGGKVIAKDLGGKLLVPEMANPAEQQLLNVVEEMAIAANMPVPPVYVLDQEYGINAFAAGHTPKDAVIGITRGAIEELTRDELQGVIGHEFSHILNGDMRLNLKLVGLLHGLLLIYILGRILFRWNRLGSRNEKGFNFAWFGLALIVIGSIGMLCGRIIKAAVSRQREFLADASAVQFTRNPAGIAEALRKIANYRHSSLVHSPYAEANSHLFFGTALRFNFLGDIFATHPPLTQRIGRLEKYGGQYRSQPSRPTASSTAKAQPSSGVTSGAGSNELVMGLAAGIAQPTQSIPSGAIAPEVSGSRGSTSAATDNVPAWLAQVPGSIRAGLRDPAGATAIALALALDFEDSALNELQTTWLKQAESADVVEEVLECHQAIANIDPRLRFALLDETVPALRQGSGSQCQQLFKTLTGLAKVDGRWSWSEYALYLILGYRLSKPKPTDESYSTLKPIWSECLLVLSALAQVGQPKPEDTMYAFKAGVYRLPGAGQNPLPELPPACNMGELKKSLDRLATASPKLKQAIIEACAYMVLLDNDVTLHEAELMRAIAVALDCALPSFLSPDYRGRKSTKIKGSMP